MGDSCFLTLNEINPGIVRLSLKRVLSLQDPPSWHPASPEVKAAAQKSREICAAHGTDLARISIKFFIRFALRIFLL